MRLIPVRSMAPSRQRGASLIEVLIAVLILAIGALGLAAMQTVSLRNNSSAMQRTQAAVLSYSIFDSMRANPDNARTGAYNTAMTCTTPDAGSTLASGDLNFWFTQLKANLHPDACASVACTGDQCTVQVRWNDDRATGGEEEQTITTRSRI